MPLQIAKKMFNGVASYIQYLGGVPIADYKQSSAADYYITPDNGADYIALVPSYTVKNTTHLKYTAYHGYRTGDYWIGNFGTQWPNQQNDENDFRIINYQEWISTYDIKEYRNDFAFVIDENTPKITVELYDHGVNIWNTEGTLIFADSWSSVGEWESNVPIWINPINNIFRVYAVQITDDIQGTILDAVVNENGLYDKVSNSYITTTGWTVGQDE